MTSCSTVAIWTKTDETLINTDKNGEEQRKTLEKWTPFIYNMDIDVVRGAICQEEKEPEGQNWTIRKRIR